MDLRTRYLGLDLRNPIVPSPSPLSESTDNLRRMEDAGAGAVVLQSLFEEQIQTEARTIDHYMTYGTNCYAESLTYFPAPNSFHFGPEEYLDHVRSAKEALEIPVIASLNGCSSGGWVEHAALIEQAGADALELNLYHIPADLGSTGWQVEEGYLEIVREVRAFVRFPIAVKIGPFFSAMGNMAHRLVEAGADGLVLFNRFYQPDIDLESLEVRPNVLLSTPQAMRLPLRWIAILHGRLKASLAATSGIHTYEDALKMLLAGADVTMFCSALLRHGIEHIAVVQKGMESWMARNDYDSVLQLKGSMSQRSCEDPTAFERANYMKAITGYHFTEASGQQRRQ